MGDFSLVLRLQSYIKKSPICAFFGHFASNQSCCMVLIISVIETENLIIKITRDLCLIKLLTISYL